MRKKCSYTTSVPPDAANLRRGRKIMRSGAEDTTTTAATAPVVILFTSCVRTTLKLPSNVMGSMVLYVIRVGTTVSDKVFENKVGLCMV